MGQADQVGEAEGGEKLDFSFEFKVTLVDEHEPKQPEKPTKAEKPRGTIAAPQQLVGACKEKDRIFDLHHCVRPGGAQIQYAIVGTAPDSASTIWLSVSASTEFTRVQLAKNYSLWVRVFLPGVDLCNTLLRREVKQPEA